MEKRQRPQSRFYPSEYVVERGLAHLVEPAPQVDAHAACDQPLDLPAPTHPKTVLLAHADHPAFHAGIIGAVSHAIKTGNIDRLHRRRQFFSSLVHIPHT